MIAGKVGRDAVIAKRVVSEIDPAIKLLVEQVINGSDDFRMRWAGQALWQFIPSQQINHDKGRDTFVIGQRAIALVSILRLNLPKEGVIFIFSIDRKTRGRLG